MKIEWINHASFILKTEGISLISDPWIEGRVFNKSWEHISASIFKYDDFKTITHIWFSHEHPDHFFPPNLSKIPNEIRKEITVLFQKTIDKKIINYCLDLGFKKAIEIPLNKWITINDVNILCNKVINETDSWLAIKKKNTTLLNINDCVFNSLSELKNIKKQLGNIDVLFTQFSYANWVGNKKDSISKIKHANEKLDEIKLQINIFKPIYTIPFASFVWFCAEDNYHMNENANSIDKVFNEIKNNNSIPIVIYPGEVWNIGEIHNSENSINKYLNDLNSIKERSLTKFEKVPFTIIEESANNYLHKALSKNNKTKLKSNKPMKIYLTDYNESFEFSFEKGLSKKLELTYDNCDIAFCSQNLKFCFDFEWGFDTIFIAGTFEKPIKGNFQNVLEYHWVNNLNNKGKRMDGVFKRLINRFIKSCA